ncbi:MAG: hypothetical protein IPK73_26060 [Candidatus Obscuribacter sp.]|nr:hypothetical protein [Candidatus Obscuribacter sp.]MBK9277590.1 hypothetical protein [Candidatus Obscuribacter sp.]
MHDLATTLGNSFAVSIVSAAAAGLAALALACGVGHLRRDKLPPQFPNDPEMYESKYLLAFKQLYDARMENNQSLNNILAGLKGQPAARLGLSAFEEFALSPEAQKAAAEANAREQAAGSPKKGKKTKAEEEPGMDTTVISANSPKPLRKPPKIAPPKGKEP